ncbi:hypothetical protein V5799_030305, partial [Amblyomma americanum]
MNVRSKSGEGAITYTLRTWEKTAKCGVLTFIDKNNNTQCELYAWDSQVVIINMTSAYLCEWEYDKLCDYKYDGSAYECKG